MSASYTIGRDYAAALDHLQAAQRLLSDHFVYLSERVGGLDAVLRARVPEAEASPQHGQPARGTWEWVEAVADCMLGCVHDCRYCYAKAESVGNGECTPEGWRRETPIPGQLRFRAKSATPQRVMFPTNHDVTPANLACCLRAIRGLLDRGLETLIVTKPTPACIERICAEFATNRERLMFRFTIGSADDAVLSFWEPGAPAYSARLAALRLAFDAGFRTSVSCEPMLDADIGRVIEQVRPFVTDAVWVGTANRMLDRVRANCPDDAAALSRARELDALHCADFVWQLYQRYERDPMLKWKESIKRIVGLPLSLMPVADR